MRIDSIIAARFSMPARIALRADMRMWIESAIASVRMTITALGLGPASSIPE